MSQPESYRRDIPETVVPGRRLGRRINHDPRSLRYLVQPTGTPTSKTWTRRIPVLDQQALGSCVGNATTGVLGTDPFFSTVITSGVTLDEAFAVKMYSAATQLDDDPDNYPPTDTGSSGLAGAKAAKNAGYISGYVHMTSVAACQTAILSGPFIVGTDWLSGMDSPNADGLVFATGSVRGGHEYECHAYDADKDLWWFYNSWGTSYGLEGRFCYTSATLAKLLAAQGDATQFVPITQPAPTPTPTPAADVDATFYRDATYCTKRSRAFKVWGKAKGFN